MKFMKFRLIGEYGHDIVINMDHVSHIAPNGAGESSVLTFATVLEGSPAYLIVTESFEEIGKRAEWKQ